MEFLGNLLVVVGLIGSLIGTLWILIVAFQESVTWGLGCILLPFPLALAFVCLHWDKAGKPFLVQLAANVSLFGGLLMVGPQG